MIYSIQKRMVILNINGLYDASERLEDTTHWAKDFLPDVKDSLFPMSVEEVRTIRLLSEEDWPRVWQPDYALMTLRQWQKTQDFDVAAETAAFRQNLGLPATFIRYYNQLSPELFPVQRVFVCELRYGFEIPLPEHKPSEEEAEAFFYGRTFTRVKDFLASLPVNGAERVFVARSSPQTLIMEWELFVDHWDVFYCNRFCTLNVINGSHDWFIFAHPERGMVWGASREFASRLGLDSSLFCSTPISYEAEFAEAHRDFMGFYRHLVDEYYRA